MRSTGRMWKVTGAKGRMLCLIATEQGLKAGDNSRDVDEARAGCSSVTAG